LVGQEFEVRASHLLGRFSTTCATPPADSYSLIYYLEIFSFFLNLGVQDFTRMCSDMFSLHILPGIWFTFNLMIQVFLCQRKIFFYFLGYHAFLASKPSESSQALVVHACNLSYLGDWDWITIQGQPGQIPCETPHLQNNEKNGLEVYLKQYNACFASAEPWVQTPVPHCWISISQFCIFALHWILYGHSTECLPSMGFKYVHNAYLFEF
jgi:hypothetical protein